MRTLDSNIISRLLETRLAPSPAICPVHHLPMLTTHSGLQQVCQNLECGETVRADGPRKADIMKDPITQAIIDSTSTLTLKPTKTIAPAKVTLPAKVDKAARAKQIDEAAAKIKAGKVETPKADPKPEKAKKEKPAKKEKDASKLSVSDVAREAGVDPKRARARMRAAVEKNLTPGPTEGRWPLVDRDSDLHKEWVAIINPSDEEPEADEDEEEGEDEE